MTATATKLRYWTARERDWLREHYPRLGAPACARRLGRTVPAVEGAVKLYGLRRHGAARESAAGLLRRAQALSMPLADQAAALGVNVDTLRQWRHRLGLTSPRGEAAEARASLAAEMRSWASFHGRDGAKGEGER